MPPPRRGRRGGLLLPDGGPVDRFPHGRGERGEHHLGRLGRTLPQVHVSQHRLQGRRLGRCAEQLRDGGLVGGVGLGGVVLEQLGLVGDDDGPVSEVGGEGDRDGGDDVDDGGDGVLGGAASCEETRDERGRE